ncbi:MAG: single-stranded-DNA-specific exonuclease RecJ [Candidatus Hydrogenedentes bacterium]|nr:single-stranded-DNA-specific exonuclease RecJ [Candidatus Hydrogenedentota bacterium]
MVNHARGHCTWHIAPDNRAGARALAQELDIHPALARVLLLRGARDAAAARQFLNPSIEDLSDPFALTDMRVAVDRITAARNNGETVMVFGDYDVDGIAGTALMVRALRRFGIARCTYGMPNRQLEGYGLSAGRVETARGQCVSLIVTVDNGISAHEAVERARLHGIDVIITDHHQIDRGIPGALAVINPKREPPDHPAANICGAGVALKLAHALTGEVHDLDLAALGTIADVVPLTGENRIIAALGLRDAAAHARPGLKALAAVSKVTLETLRSEDVAFQLAPRINAGGRMSDGLAGLELLLTDSHEEARHNAEDLDAANEERKAVETGTLAEALALLKADFSQDQRAIVLANRGWHRGVIGIVASRVQATHFRPVVMIALDGEGLGRGSARSIHGFNIAAAFETCSDHLEACGGHAMAAGLTIREEKLPAFCAAFEQAARAVLAPGELSRVLEIDTQVSLTEVDPRLVRTMEKLQPFGQGNSAPVFCSFGVQAPVDSWRLLRGGHLKFCAKDGPKLVDVIGFRMGDRMDALAGAEAFDIAFTPQLNTWRGETNVQLVLKDIRVAGGE